MAAETVFGVTPAGMFYIGLKGGVEYAGWSEVALSWSQPIPEDWLERTRADAARGGGDPRRAAWKPRPPIATSCRYCDCRDVCRVERGRGGELAEGA